MSSQNTITKVSCLGLYYFQYLYKNEKEERGRGWTLARLRIVMLLDFSYVLSLPMDLTLIIFTLILTARLCSKLMLLVVRCMV